MKFNHLIVLSVISASCLMACQSTGASKANETTSTVQAQNLSDRDKLKNLMTENAVIDLVVEKIIERNNGAFLKKAPVEYHTCIKENYSINGFQKIEANIIDSYIQRLSDENIKEHIALLSQFSGKKSIGQTFKRINEGNATTDDYAILKNPTFLEIVNSEKYTELSSVLNLDNALNNDASLAMKGLVLWGETMNTCNVPLVVPKN